MKNYLIKFIAVIRLLSVRFRQSRKLTEITDEDAIEAAAIAKIGNNPTIERSGGGRDKDCIIITDGKKERSIRIYFNGSNTRVLDRGFEVIEYCYDVYDFLRRRGYDWRK